MSLHPASLKIPIDLQLKVGMSMEKKKVVKIDRRPLENDSRVMFSSRVSKSVLKEAKKACKKKYKVGLTSKIEDILIKEFSIVKK